MKALHYVLAPVAVPQALWLRRTAIQLQEPPGARHGVVGQGRKLRLLITGDSSAAGVGTSHQREALSGQLTNALAHDFEVTWRLHAKCGATAPTTIERLEAAETEPFDVALIALGVNDAKNGHTLAGWKRSYTALLDLIEEKFGVTRIIASGLPPVEDFPLLRWPTRSVIATRAEMFDEALQDIVASRADRTQYLTIDMRLDESVMAEDGFHPGPMVYAEWARAAAEMIGEDFKAKS